MEQVELGAKAGRCREETVIERFRLLQRHARQEAEGGRSAKSSCQSQEGVSRLVVWASGLGEEISRQNERIRRVALCIVCYSTFF